MSGIIMTKSVSVQTFFLILSEKCDYFYYAE